MNTKHAIVAGLLAATAIGLAPAAAQPAAPPKAAPLPDAATLLKVSAPSGAQGDSWASIAQLPALNGKWAAAADGGAGGAPSCPVPAGAQRNPISCMNLPLTPRYREYFIFIRSIAEAGGDVPSGAPRCVPGGYTGSLGGGLGGMIEILQSPKQVTVLAGDVPRRIYVDGRKHPQDPDPTFMGDNIAHWENGTLVIDTIGIDPRASVNYGIPGGEHMHVIQRISLSDPNTLQMVSVLEAPEALTQPLVRRQRLVRETRYDMEENVCAANNRDVSPSGGQIWNGKPPPETAIDELWELGKETNADILPKLKPRND